MSEGAILFLLFCVGIIAVAWTISWLDERSQRQARVGGCICALGQFVEHIRSDCPYHAALESEGNDD